MNAVAAVFGAADPQAAQAAIRTMLDRMPRRAAGHRVIVAGDGGVVAAAGASPAFGSHQHAGILAGDLRLDNAPELRRELDLPADAADPVIVLEAFARWGDDFAARLAGDFALVILDRVSRRLLAVRDALGIRPLYYRAGTSHVRCASEIAALIESGDAPDEGFLAEALGGDIVDPAGTPYLSVKRVPAGHRLVASESGLTITRYWHPPQDMHGGPLEEHAERFREAFDEAVRARCAGLTDVAAHLSGGLDSSSVLASVCANGFATPIAGSLRFPWPEADESAWIAAAASRWSIDPIFVQPATNPAAHDLASIAEHGDLPDYPTGGPMFMPLHAALTSAGARVGLTGLGGDQWWSGEMAHMADLLRRGRFGALRAWQRAGESIGAEVAWSWGAFARDGVIALMPSMVRRSLRHLVPAALPPWIDPRFASRVELRDRWRRRPDTRGAPAESWRRMRWRLDSGEEAFSLERADRLAVASGLELRHPFYDRRLVELAFRTPEDGRIGPTRNRAAMRAAMAPRLAPETAARVTKADVSRILIEAARAPEVRPHLATPTLNALGWVVPREIAAMTARALDAGDAAAASSLWRVIGVDAWLAERFGGR